MTAPILEIADEVVGHVNDVLVSQSGQPMAVRQFNPIVNLKDLSDLRCVVYPARNVSETDLTRKLRQHEYDLQILVQAKLGPPHTVEWSSQIDALIGLVETLAEKFRSGEPLPTTHAYGVACDIEPIFAAEHLDQRNVFSSVINLTFRQERS